MATFVKRCGQLGRTFRHPFERTHRIAHRRSFGEALQISHQGRIAFAQRLRTPTLATHPAFRQRTLRENVLAAIDGGAGKPADLAHHGKRPVASSTYLVGCKQPLAALVQLAAQSGPAQFDPI